MRSRSIVAAVLAASLWACSGFTEYHECQGDETAPCETSCGPGTMTCEDGRWGICQLNELPACLPGEFGTCELGPDTPPGLWFCSDTCEIGPCVSVCNPGDTFECDGICGYRGRMTCRDDGSWSGCEEYINPPCLPGEVELCQGPDGPGHRRCSDQCEFGPCDGSLTCFPGESANCGQCAGQSCNDEGLWGECVPFDAAACTPGDSRDCRSPCGDGVQYCSDRCTWSDCYSSGECVPGQRQICPYSLYCGVAYRICGPTCSWLPCIEAGG